MFLPMMERRVVYYDLRCNLTNVRWMNSEGRDGGHFLLWDLDSLLTTESDRFTSLPMDGRLPQLKASSLNAVTFVFGQVAMTAFAAAKHVDEAEFRVSTPEEEQEQGSTLWRDTVQSPLRVRFDEWVEEQERGGVVGLAAAVETIRRGGTVCVDDVRSLEKCKFD
mmetsp:Transcript_36893/g.87189  ORF Transcript_36893/g.87189 Transcript_36893/m.87189 type:complete len:165 (+) Transcript_36893:656-1150(+)